MSDSPSPFSYGFTGFAAAFAAAVDDSALVHVPASAYVPRASVDPEHRIGTPEHYEGLLFPQPSSHLQPLLR